jgi:SAM-dependent methyltransferase
MTEPNLKGLQPSKGFEYYASTLYWNNFDVVNAVINTSISGDPTKNWMHYTSFRYGPFSRVYSLNCGNGWVEREFYKTGGAGWFFGSDINTATLATARLEAERIGMPAEYAVIDANNPCLPDIEFDCILNHAAMHHVAYIDRMTRQLCVHCRAGGYLVSFDYIGPHRNQYSWDAWSAAMEMWRKLPPEFRTEMSYPHQTTMLAVDPTEAVHSELILPTMMRYFDIVETRALGGAIAYLLLFQNNALHEAVRRGAGAGWLERILNADAEYTQGQIDRSLFAFVVAQPKKHVLDEQAQLDQWSAEESAREVEAVANGGRYAPPNPLEIIYDHFIELKTR